MEKIDKQITKYIRWSKEHYGYIDWNYIIKVLSAWFRVEYGMDNWTAKKLAKELIEEEKNEKVNNS